MSKLSKRGKLTERQADIPYLLAERPHSLRELAHHFGVNKKTVKRSIESLMPYYPIMVNREGREVYYSFSDGYRFRQPPFTPEEVAVLLLAQEAIVATGPAAMGSPFSAHARSMLAKARASLHPSLRERLDQLAAVYGTAAVPAKDFSRHADTINRLTTAAIERRKVRLRYYTLHADTISERTVEPYCVYFDPDGATLKLIAYDHKRSDKVPFSIDHIKRLWILNERFTRPADFNLQEFLAENCFNGIHGKPVTVKLRARGVTARIFAERTFHRSQRVVERTLRSANSEETITIEMRVAGGRGLMRFILSWGADVEVLEPAELRREVAAAHRSALAQYGEGD